MYLIDYLFYAQCTIRSLPLYHGARWSALLRHVYRNANLVPETMFVGLLPMRYGQKTIQKGENYAVRVLLTDAGMQNIEIFTTAFANTLTQGEFSSASFSLYGYKDPVNPQPIYTLTGAPPIPPLHTDRMQSCITQLTQQPTWSLHFHTPLRLTKPPFTKHSKDSAKKRFCKADFFAPTDNIHTQNALEHLLVKIRYAKDIPPYTAITLPTLQDSTLSWKDMRYNAQRSIALGGLVGTITFIGAPSPEVATHLVYGQYVGIGKNARFGLGYYTITLPS